MAYQHTNRCGEAYFIQASERGGKIAYSASRKPTGKPVDRLPEGYEVYERPENGQVFVRKIKPTLLLPMERQQVESAVRRMAGLEHFIVDVEAKSLVVYLADAEDDATLSLMRDFNPMSPEKARSMREYLLRRSRYVKMMRFTLTDAKSRRFSIERWCFRGSIDHWIWLSGSKPLLELMERYVPHLSKESFYDLM